MGQTQKTSQKLTVTTIAPPRDETSLIRIMENIPIFFQSTPVRNLRIYSIMVAIHHLILAQLCMFLVVMALFHAEEMMSILEVDIADQKDREEYYELPMHENGETMNQVRFNTATKLASNTMYILYVCGAVVGVYMLCCLSLVWGTIRCRSEMFLPWLINHAVLRAVSILVLYHSIDWVLQFASEFKFWIMVSIALTLDIIFYTLIYRYYFALKSMQKLTKSATVAIPYPKPTPKGTTIPVQYRKQKTLHSADGSQKHFVTADHINYVV